MGWRQVYPVRRQGIETRLGEEGLQYSAGAALCRADQERAEFSGGMMGVSQQQQHAGATPSLAVPGCF